MIKIATNQYSIEKKRLYGWFFRILTISIACKWCLTTNKDSDSGALELILLFCEVGRANKL